MELVRVVGCWLLVVVAGVSCCPPHMAARGGEGESIA
jgi:hypothetical protein